jgi:hypothetical protein
MIISGSLYFVKGTWRKWICELNPEMFGSMWLKASVTLDFGGVWQKASVIKVDGTCPHLIILCHLRSMESLSG